MSNPTLDIVRTIPTRESRIAAAFVKLTNFESRLRSLRIKGKAVLS
jgi:hypothetical protein